jgi:hypothetical protein
VVATLDWRKLTTDQQTAKAPVFARPASEYPKMRFYPPRKQRMSKAAVNAAVIGERALCSRDSHANRKEF